MKYQMNLRLCNDEGEKFFGKGVTDLLRYIQQEGSLNLAVKKMGIAYSKAWKILKRAEEELGYPLLVRQSGGKNGGGSMLTEDGARFLEKYENFQQEAVEVIDRLYEKWYTDMD